MPFLSVRLTQFLTIDVDQDSITVILSTQTVDASVSLTWEELAALAVIVRRVLRP